MKDYGRGQDVVTVKRSGSSLEKGKWQAHWTIEKYADDEAFAQGNAYERTAIPGNILLNGGIEELLDLLTASGGTAFTNSTARIGVGDGTTAENPTQTGLVGPNTEFKGMDTGYPSRVDQTVSFRATFSGAEANFDWNELSVDNGIVTLNRKVSNQGTKASGQTWSVTLEITIS